jgi:putative membrane-bound dehydrogenase-like protein
MHDYPIGLDGNLKPGGRIAVLTDSNSDGAFDRVDRLVDDVPFPTGVMAWKKGALVCAAPDILYLEDTNQDGRADVRRALFSGFATHNYQARVNSLRWGLDGWVYGAAGLFGGTIHSHLTGKDHQLSGRDFRIRPDTGEFEAVGGLSQQGRARDDFGNGFGCDNGMWMWHFPFPEHYLARNPGLKIPESRVVVAQGPEANRVYPTRLHTRTFQRPAHGRAHHLCLRTRSLPRFRIRPAILS